MADRRSRILVIDRNPVDWQAKHDEFISRGERLKSVNAENAIGILMDVH